jgi:hypothetical protein
MNGRKSGLKNGMKVRKQRQSGLVAIGKIEHGETKAQDKCESENKSEKGFVEGIDHTGCASIC